MDVENADMFKKELDSFLSQVPDQPTVAGYGRSAETNSLLHQLPLFLINNWPIYSLFYWHMVDSNAEKPEAFV